MEIVSNVTLPSAVMATTASPALRVWMGACVPFAMVMTASFGKQGDPSSPSSAVPSPVGGGGEGEGGGGVVEDVDDDGAGIHPRLGGGGGDALDVDGGGWGELIGQALLSSEGTVPLTDV